MPSQAILSLLVRVPHSERPWWKRTRQFREASDWVTDGQMTPFSPMSAEEKCRNVVPDALLPFSVAESGLDARNDLGQTEPPRRASLGYSQHPEKHYLQSRQEALGTSR